MKEKEESNREKQNDMRVNFLAQSIQKVNFALNSFVFCSFKAFVFDLKKLNYIFLI